MNLELRCVFDTNAIVSAALFEHSIPGRAFYAALDRGVVVLSPATFVELTDVLRRKKFDRYLTVDEREQFLAKLLHDARLIETTETIRQCRDPKDDKFLELVVGGAASCLASGDEDLLILDPFRGVPILTPTKFLERVAEFAPPS